MTAEYFLIFDQWLNELFTESTNDSVLSLVESQKYSLTTGGKRFRPYLIYLIFNLWTHDLNKIKNFSLAIEMIHTYSLIHDDLPCMDNDDYRRGHLTNHKVFGEDIALLAGDALLTDAIYQIANDETLSDKIKIQLIQLVSLKTGSRGMVGGQVLDMKSTPKISIEELEQIHKLKTANLIETAALGAAIIADQPKEIVLIIGEFSRALGLAFQIKDDLLDFEDKEQDFKNYVKLLGLNSTVQLLNETTQICLKCLSNDLFVRSVQSFESIEILRQLVIQNQNRSL